MRRRAPLLPMACCLVAGLVVSQWLPHYGYSLWALVAMVVLTGLAGRRAWLQTLGIGCCTVLLGMVLGGRSRQRLQVDWPAERRSTDVVVVGEPTMKANTVVMDVLTTTDHHRLRCSIARDARSARIRVGHGLKLRAVVKKVHAWRQGHFDYQRYMLSHGFSGELFAGTADWQWHAQSLAGLSMMERARLRFLGWRHRLLARYRQWGIGQEALPVVSAITLGDKSRLNSQLKDIYAQAGASHVLALSGLHLMIVYAVVSLLFGWRRFRLLSQVVTVMAIWAFAFLVGLSPSVVRSALMITLYALLSLGYRERMSVNTLAFAAIVMLVVSPLAVYDLGFQLSFLSVLSILLFCPLLTDVIPAHVLQRHRWLRTLWTMTTVSVAAQLGTAPLVAFYFERFATLFLLTNFVVIPLTTLILYLTLVVVATPWWTLLQTGLAVLLSAVAVLMNRLVEWMTQWPFSTVGGIHLSLLQLLLLYVVVASLYFLLRRN